MKTLDRSFRNIPLDRLPEPRMEGVEFGFLRAGAGERIRFEAKMWSWFFQVREGAMEMRFAHQPPIVVTSGGCIGIDGRTPFEMVEISKRPGGSRMFETLEPWSRQDDRPLQLIVGHAPLAANLLLGSFSEIVHVPVEYPGPAPGWIAKLTDLIIAELSAGTESVDRAGVIQRLAELIVITLVRHMIEDTAQMRENLPTALQDARIWRALAAFHRAPAASWTVEGLALVAGMSRTAFAVRFHELVGVPPLQCLTQIRMNMAADMLLREDASVKQIAERVGYSTEAAFNRAFVRFAGSSPGRWRRWEQGGSA